MSSFRTRSLLVWPQIHCSMRISTALSCYTCRLLVDQHSAPYNMVGQIVVLQNFPFSFYGTLGPHKTPEAWCHFNQLILILGLTSSSTSPSFWSINPKKRNVSFLDTTWQSSLTLPSSYVIASESHFMYSVLYLPSLKPFASKVRLHNSNFWSTPVLLSSTKITSFKKSMHQGIPPCMSLVTSFITKVKR
jgi:hypothetical protein